MAQTWRILAKNVTRHSGERRRKVFVRIISHGEIRNEVPNANIQVLKILVYVALLSSIYQMPVLPHTRPHRRDFLSQKEQHYASRSKMSSQKAGRYNAKPPSAKWKIASRIFRDTYLKWRVRSLTSQYRRGISAIISVRQTLSIISGCNLSENRRIITILSGR